jgi:homoserine dehydrogenase
VFVTHRARESALSATLDSLRNVDSVHRVGSMLRVLGDED